MPSSRLIAAACLPFMMVGQMRAQADTLSKRPFFARRDVAIFEAFAIATVADPGAPIIGIGMYTYGKLTTNIRAADLGPLMYGGAATVAWSRMYDNKHWASDVITGAAIGTFSGLKVVHWHHPPA